jgi:hypothetical protein
MSKSTFLNPEFDPLANIDINVFRSLPDIIATVSNIYL